MTEWGAIFFLLVVAALVEYRLRRIDEGVSRVSAILQDIEEEADAIRDTLQNIEDSAETVVKVLRARRPTT